MKERKRDIVILLIMVAISGAIAYFLQDLIPARFDPPFVYIWVILALTPIFVAYTESRDKDPFVTGKTQSMGVVNSFTTAAVVIGLMSKGLVGWIITAITVSVCMFIARELGRKARKKLEERFLGKTGVLLDDLHNFGMAFINGEKIKVCSKTDLPKGTQVKITAIKSKYLYVEKIEA